MTNDTDLCSNDDFWKEISCDLHKPDTNYLGKRCTGCTTGTSNYCFYPHGLPDHFVEFLPTTCDCVTSSPSMNNDTLVKCHDYYGDGMMCNGNCLPAALWCNDKFNKRCDGVITNDPDLCADDQRWKDISCNLTIENGTHYPGERCTGCTPRTSNYCFYPQGSPSEDYFSTTCDCVSTASFEDVSTASASTSTVILMFIIIIVMIATMGGGVYYHKKKKEQGPSHEAPVATQESEMGKMSTIL